MHSTTPQSVFHLAFSTGSNHDKKRAHRERAFQEEHQLLWEGVALSQDCQDIFCRKVEEAWLSKFQQIYAVRLASPQKTIKQVQEPN